MTAFDILNVPINTPGINPNAPSPNFNLGNIFGLGQNGQGMPGVSTGGLGALGGPGAAGGEQGQMLEGALAKLQEPGGIDNFLKEMGVDPNSAVGQQMKEMLQLLIAMLMKGKDQNGNPVGGEQGGAPAGGEAGKGGGAEGAGGGGAEAAGGSSGSKGAHDGVENVDGPNGFLWKPQSESDGNLVVLLPPGLKGNVDSVEIQGANGEVLDRGKFAGDNKNGGRPHFRFGKPGAEYGDGVKVVAKMKDGSTQSFDIKRGAARND